MNKKESLMKEVLARASTDATFRRGLLSDPHLTLRKACGLVVPTSFRLLFIERTPDVDALIVLPQLKAPLPSDQIAPGTRRPPPKPPAAGTLVERPRLSRDDEYDDADD